MTLALRPVSPAPAPALSCEALETEITTLAAHLNAGTFRFLALIADFDSCQGWGGWGIRSCAHWLNWKCGLGLNAAREQLRVAHALRELPHVSDAMRQGQLSYTKVRAITRVATAENEQALLAIARNGTASHIETVVRHYRRSKRIEALQRDTERHDSRTLRYFWDHDGCLVIEARLPPEHGALVVQALRAADEALRPHPIPVAAPSGHAQRRRDERRPEPAPTHAARTEASTAPLEEVQQPSPSAALPPPGRERFAGLNEEEQEALERLEVALAQQPQIFSYDEAPTSLTGAAAPGPDTFTSAKHKGPDADVSAETSLPLGWAQRQADAFSLMAETLLAAGPRALKGGDRHIVNVRVDLEALCHPEGPGTSALEHGPSIPPETVRRLCCDGGLVTWLEDGTGRTLDVGRKTRVVPTALRRLIQRRDGGCRFPGCEQHRFTDVHHIQHWVDGGRTDERNLIEMCRYHHRILHEGGYRISGDAHEPVFIDEVGEVLRPEPSLPTLPRGDALPAQHRERGLDLHARTAIPGWGGERADYTWMLTILDQHDRRAAAREPTQC